MIKRLNIILIGILSIIPPVFGEITTELVKEAKPKVGTPIFVIFNLKDNLKSRIFFPNFKIENMQMKIEEASLTKMIDGKVKYLDGKQNLIYQIIPAQPGIYVITMPNVKKLDENGIESLINTSPRRLILDVDSNRGAQGGVYYKRIGSKKELEENPWEYYGVIKEDLSLEINELGFPFVVQFKKGERVSISSIEFDEVTLDSGLSVPSRSVNIFDNPFYYKPIGNDLSLKVSQEIAKDIEASLNRPFGIRLVVRQEEDTEISHLIGFLKRLETDIDERVNKLNSILGRNEQIIKLGDKEVQELAQEANMFSNSVKGELEMAKRRISTEIEIAEQLKQVSRKNEDEMNESEERLDQLSRRAREKDLQRSLEEIQEELKRIRRNY
jgi:hypothetical protein